MCATLLPLILSFILYILSPCLPPASEPYMASPVLVSTLNIVHGHLSPMDLVLIETADGKVR